MGSFEFLDDFHIVVQTSAFLLFEAFIKPIIPVIFFDEFFEIIKFSFFFIFMLEQKKFFV